MTVEISQPEGLNFEEPISANNFNAFLEALPVVFNKEKIVLAQLDSDEIGLLLENYNVFIELWLLTEDDELFDGITTEDLPIVGISLNIIDLVSSNLEENPPVEEAHQLIKDVNKAFFEQFGRSEDAYLQVHVDSFEDEVSQSSEPAKIHLDIELEKGPTIRKVLESISYTINVAKGKKGFVDQFIKNWKPSLN